MFAYVGGYTTPDRNGRGNGINVYRLPSPGGAWTHLQHVEGLENPTLFTLNQAMTRLYSVHGGRRWLSAFAIDRASGRLSLLNQIDCGGRNPVDSALDPTERFLVVANYGSGEVAVAALAEDGRLADIRQVFTLPGRPGPHPKEQTSSHPHAVIFDPTGRFVIVPDKGFDRTYLFRFENGTLTPTAQGSIASAAGAAPRHAAFHPTLPVLYVNNELDSTVTVYDWDDGSVAERQVIRTIPDSHAGPNTTAEIVAAPDGRHLYVSNRGEDSIARFEIDPATGLLSYAGSVPTGGKRPRFFTLDPTASHVYAGNQDSDLITVFRIEQPSGHLVPTGVTVAVGSPSAISLVPSP